MPFFSVFAKTKTRTAGKAEGTAPHGAEYRKPPVVSALASTGCRTAASPRERESTRSTGKRGVGEGNDYRSKKSVQTRADRTGALV